MTQRFPGTLKATRAHWQDVEIGEARKQSEAFVYSFWFIILVWFPFPSQTEQFGWKCPAGWRGGLSWAFLLRSNCPQDPPTSNCFLLLPCCSLSLLSPPCPPSPSVHCQGAPATPCFYTHHLHKSSSCLASWPPPGSCSPSVNFRPQWTSRMFFSWCSPLCCFSWSLSCSHLSPCLSTLPFLDYSCCSSSCPALCLSSSSLCIKNQIYCHLLTENKADCSFSPPPPPPNLDLPSGWGRRQRCWRGRGTTPPLPPPCCPSCPFPPHSSCSPVRRLCDGACFPAQTCASSFFSFWTSYERKMKKRRRRRSSFSKKAKMTQRRRLISSVFSSTCANDTHSLVLSKQLIHFIPDTPTCLFYGRGKWK